MIHESSRLPQEQKHTSCSVNQKVSLSLFFLSPVASDSQLIWDNPSKVGTYDVSCDCYRGTSWGWRNFVKHFDLRRRNYLKNDDLIIFINFEGKLCVRQCNVFFLCKYISHCEH